MRNPQQIVNEKYLAAAVVFSEVWPIISRHKKITLLVVAFHIWVYSLAFRHIAELRDLADLFPLLGGIFGQPKQ